MGEYIHAEGLRKVYQVGEKHVEAVRGVDLLIQSSDFVVILGHSGSGKTTLVSMIGGLTRPSMGKVLIEDVDIWGLSDKLLSGLRNKKIGFIFQSFSLLPSLNVLNNVVMPVIFRNNSRKNRETVKDKAMTILTDLEMKDKVNSYPSELSGGEQRRAAIARALINDPEIILADEPTGELDLRTEREVIEIFRQINEKYQKTIIAVTHSLSWLEMAKTVIIMKDGLIYRDVEDPVKVLTGRD